MRFGAVERLADGHPVRRLCQVLGVSVSGYYRWAGREQGQRVREDRLLKQQIVEAHAENGGRYGTPRIERALRRKGVGTSRKRVARLRRELGLRAKASRRYRVTTRSDHAHPVAPNLLERCFEAPAADRVWVGDITYLATDEGWLYVAAILDTFSRRIVGWAASERLDRDLVLAAFDRAVASRTPDPGLLHHSDRGSQYCSHEYRQRLEAVGVVVSMSSRGDCWDNAMIESFFKTLKVEHHLADHQRRPPQHPHLHLLQPPHHRRHRLRHRRLDDRLERQPLRLRAAGDDPAGHRLRHRVRPPLLGRRRAALELPAGRAVAVDDPRPRRQGAAGAPEQRWDVWTVLKDYVYRDGALVAAVTPAETVHFHPDHLGSPRLVTGTGGAFRAYHLYHPYGAEATAISQDTERMKFTAHERDMGVAGSAADDLDYMHARFCSPLTGRFLSLDPAGGRLNRPQSWNRYSYALGNPVKWVDPTGETISLANLTDEQRDKLLADLNNFTGNTYGVNDNLELVLEEVGVQNSQTATEFLGALIASPVAFNVASSSDKSAWSSPGFDVKVNLGMRVDYGRVDPRTLNSGSTPVHELFHAVTGLADTPDGNPATPRPNDQSWTGPVVDFVNGIRQERGLPTRAAYGVTPTTFASRGTRMLFDNVDPAKPEKRFVVKRWAQ